MKKLLYIFSFVISMGISISNMMAYAAGNRLTATTFYDYEPFGHMIDIANAESVFDSSLKSFLKENGYKLGYKLFGSETDDIRNMRSGSIDLVLGAYHATKFYGGMEYVFPAVIGNPIRVAMMPNNIGKVKSREDLKSLKGVRIKTEHFSDYVENELKSYDIEYVDNIDKAYEKLFIGETDYILGGYYYMLLNAIKLGIRPYISFSQSELWNIPVFIGISKMTKHNRINLLKILGIWANKAETKQEIQDKIRKIIDDAELKYAGTVPPMYIKNENTESPAEQQQSSDEAVSSGETASSEGGE